MRFHPALFLIAALGMTAAAQADTSTAVPDATQKSITAMYALRCTAVQDPTDKNLDAAFAMLAPDFVAIDPKGKEHKRDEIVATQRMQIKQIEADDCTNSLDTFAAPDANTVTLVNTSHVTGSVQAPDAKHQIDATVKSADTWKLVNGAWMEEQSKSLRALVKVDGNVVEDTGN
ncbi:MAG TPA: nuclear transport factor 2 family protein [Candidatus Baltobacteraceae bacterium]|nr:nuclear transport factor 2 family protein [Candidatus Baltobacteraceae bacterium]